MLGKLIKHEFRATSRVMLPGFAGVLGLSVLANISSRVLASSSSEFLSIIAGLITAAFVIALVALGLLATVIMVNRFYKNLMGDEGYIMFTLPVSVHGIIWSRLIVSLIWFICTMIVFALSILAASFRLEYVAQFVAQLRYAVSTILHYYSLDVNFLLITFELLLLALAAGITSCLLFYAAISVGCGFTRRKALLSIAFFFAFSFVLQLAGTFAISVFGRIESIETASRAVDAFHQVIGISLGSTLACGGALYFVTAHSLKNRLNLQ